MGVQAALKDIQSGFLSATTHTANNTLIEEALDKALDRTGNTNNAMVVNFDMGLNRIINLDATPVSPFDATSKQYVDDILETNNSAAAEAAASAAAALQSEINASVSESNAQASAISASTSAVNAAASETNAAASEATSSANASTTTTNAINAANSETNAAQSAAEALVSEQNAAISAFEAGMAAQAALDPARFLVDTDFATIGGVDDDFGGLDIMGADFANENVASPRSSLSLSTGDYDYGSVA